MPDLTDRDKAILDFEGGPHWVYAGAKEDEIRRRFDLSATAYYQRLNALIDRPEALAYAPVVVKRRLRLRETRRRARAPLTR
jgi:hypothetical protein